jgi:hypothetical protein
MQLKTLFLGTALTLAYAAPGLAQEPAAKPAQGGVPAAAPAKPAAGMPAQAASAEAFDAKVARRMDASEVKRRMDAGEKVIVVDTRSSFSGPMAKGAEHVTYDKLDAWAKDHAKDALVVAYCT